MGVEFKKKSTKNEERKRICEGSFENLPHLESKIVRVFLSSTFTDYGEDRNYIIEHAVPELRTFCWNKGLEFQVADMRWGVRDDASDEHSTTDIVLKEVLVCQQISRGPTFVAFLGNRYGSRPYPSEIEQDEYEALYEVAGDLNLDTKLLDDWYKRDRNAIPVVYKLLPITYKLKYYNDTNPKNSEKRERDQEEWNAIDTLLGNLWKKTAHEAEYRGVIDAETKHRYYQSVTENEVKHGILKYEKRDLKTICFTREMNSIKLSDTKAKRYIDLDAGVLDEEAIDLLNDLKQSKVPNDLKDQNIHHSEVKWTSQGIDVDDPDHAQYLQSLCEKFLSEMKRLIEENLQKSNIEEDQLCEEVAHHSYFCVQKSKGFTGRQDQLKEIHSKLLCTFDNPLKLSSVDELGDMKEEMEKEVKEGTENHHVAGDHLEKLGVSYSEEISELDSKSVKDIKMKMLEFLQTDEVSRPLLIYGEAGTGKTALLSKVIHLVSEWTESPNIVRVIRYIGTSRKSTTVRNLLLNMCLQISCAYDIEVPTEVDLSQDFPFLVSYFQSLLSKINVKDKPLLLALDSVEELSTDDGSMSLNWIPQNLPVNVYFIVTLQPEVSDCLKNAHKVMADGSRFVEVPSLPVKVASTLIDTWMGDTSRTITSTQKSKVLTGYESVQLPLYLRMISNRAVKWTSYARESEMQLSDSLKAECNLLYDELEKEYGHSMIQKAFGYLALARNGLSDAEMEDLLSLSDEVLQDSYLYQLPPNPKSIRLPTLLWRRVRYHIPEDMVSRQIDNADLLRWYHRVMRDTAAERYAPPDVRVSLHGEMVDYFSGDWHDVIKPLELYKVKKASYPECKRGVPKQPITFCPNVFNLRKLNELPYHLIKSHQFERLKTDVLANFNWLYDKFKATSVVEVLWDYERAVDELEKMVGVGDKVAHLADCQDHYSEIKLLYDILVLCSDSVHKDVNNFPIQIIGQLGQDFDGMCDGRMMTAVKSLHTQAVSWCNETSLSMVIPRGPCLPPAGHVLKKSVDISIAYKGDAYKLENKVCLSADGRRLYAVDRDKIGDVLKIFDMNNNASIMRNQPLLNADVMSINLIGSDRYLEIFTYKQRDAYDPEKRLLVWDNLLQIPVHLSMTANGFYISPSGKYAVLIYLEEKEPQDKKKKPRSFKTGASTQKSYCELIEVKEMTSIATLAPPAGEDELNATCARFSLDEKIVAVYMGGKVAVYSVLNGKLQRYFSVDDSESKSTLINEHIIRRTMHMLPGNRLVCPGADYQTNKNIYVRDLNNGKLVCEFKMHEYSVDQIIMNKTSTVAVSFTSDSGIMNNNKNKHIYVWDLKTGNLMSACENHEPCLAAVLCGQKEEYLLTANDNSALIRVWYVGSALSPYANALPIKDIIGHALTVTSLLVMPDSSTLISASVDNTIKFYNLTEVLQECGTIRSQHIDLEQIRVERQRPADAPYKMGEGPIVTTAMGVFKQGKMAVVGTDDGWIILYNLVTMEIAKYKRLSTGSVSSILVSRDGRYIIVAVKNEVHVMDASKDDQNTLTLQCEKNINCLVEAKGILVAASGGMDGHGYVFDITTGQHMTTLKALYGFNQVAITSDAKKVVTTMFDFPFIQVLEDDGNEAAKQVAMELQQKAQEAMDTNIAGCVCLKISPNDKFVVSCSTDGSVRVMETKRGQYRFRMQHRSTVVEATYTPDSRQLLTCGFKTIIVWSMKDGSLVTTLSRHENFIRRLCFCQGGRFLVSCAEDKTILVWDYRRGVSVCSFQAHCPVGQISVAHDLSSIMFPPENIAYVGVLQPNPALQKVLDGETMPVSDVVQTAQAIALSFSTKKIADQTTRACQIL